MSLRSEDPTVLVADDYEDTRWLLRCWLERKGYAVVEAADGVEAVELAVACRPDLILMDIEMPKLDGLGATRRLRARGDFDRVPIIAVSAYGESEYRQRALDAGCTEYVMAPFTPDELGAMIENLLGVGAATPAAEGEVLRWAC